MLEQQWMRLEHIRAVSCRAHPGALLTLTLCAFACTGRVSDGSGTDGESPTGGKNAQGGSAGTSSGGRTGGGTSGSSGSTGGGGPVETPPPGAKCDGSIDPGRTGIRRLTRDEYDNTVRDLLGDSTRPARGFPDDDHSEADLMTVSTLLVSKFEEAADQLVEAAWTRESGGKTPPNGKLFVCAPKAADADCGKKIVKAFARKAFRTPTSDADLKPYLDLVGTDGVEGTKAGLKAILLSPRFMYRLELDPSGDSVTRPLTAHEVASRLSYTLWASAPDPTLDALADSGELLKAGVVDQQVKRMLGDAKADALATSLGARWLGYTTVETAQPDSTMFPDINQPLLTSMRVETEDLLKELFGDKGSILDLVNAPFTFADAALAKHYGLDGAKGDQVTRLALTNSSRRGLLGQGSFLVSTSTPVRTSAVKRGKYVLGRLLCMPPPPPPPGANVEKPDTKNAKTERERLMLHRTEPKCATCHNLIDPIGLGLEGYDPVGRPRTEVNGITLDTSGSVPIGDNDSAVPFKGAAELSDKLRSSRAYAGCVATQLVTYALGREPTSNESCLVGEVADALDKAGATTADGWKTLFASRAFLNRHGEAVTGGP